MSAPGERDCSSTLLLPDGRVLGCWQRYGHALSHSDPQERHDWSPGAWLVIRAALDAPWGWAGGFEGCWIARADLAPAGTVAAVAGRLDVVLATAVAVATDRYEMREDGAVAQVYEVPAGRGPQ